jgi:hypothetical protein
MSLNFFWLSSESRPYSKINGCSIPKHTTKIEKNTGKRLPLSGVYLIGFGVDRVVIQKELPIEFLH